MKQVLVPNQLRGLYSVSENSTEGMPASLARVKAAVSNKEIVAYLTHYYVNKGEIIATDGRMVAGTPFPDDREYLVPAAPFEKAIAMAGEKGKIVMGNDGIRVSLSRSRVNIKTLSPDQFSHFLPTGERYTLPSNLIATLGRLRPFVGDDASRQWSNGIFISKGSAYATNNVIVAAAKLDSDIGKAVIPSWTVDYLLAQPDEPVEMSLTDTMVAFFYEDKSWMASVLIADEPPDALMELCDPIPITPCGDEISQDWRSGFADVCKIAETEVLFTAETLSGGRTSADIEVDVVTPIASPTYWHPKFVDLVVKTATHWDLSKAPSPCLWWSGEDMRGLIVGRK